MYVTMEGNQSSLNKRSSNLPDKLKSVKLFAS